MVALLRCAALTLGLLVAAAMSARAEPSLRPDEVGGFLGAHIFSDRIALGDTGSGASIANAVVFGPRVAYVWLPWLAVEAELPIGFAGGRNTDADVAVTLLLPRTHARARIDLGSSAVPFAVLGVGVPISLSDNRPVLASDVSAHVYAGGGVLFTHEPTWNLRLDARVFVGPAAGEDSVAAEVEVSVSLFRSFGAAPHKRRLPANAAPASRDSDEDGFLDSEEKCSDRAEDVDGFEDQDGCPDIDNDLDLVLDIADRCPMESESHNGYEDDDGCPDTVPPEVQRIAGMLRDSTFAPGSAELDSAARRRLRRMARILTQHESVRIVVIGYTDDREAPESGVDLSLQRAQAVREYLVGAGVAAWRIRVAGAGAEDPVASNESRRGRRRNRRVEINLRVYGETSPAAGIAPASSSVSPKQEGAGSTRENPPE